MYRRQQPQCTFRSLLELYDVTCTAECADWRRTHGEAYQQIPFIGVAISLPCSQAPSILDTLTVSLLWCFLKISLDSFLSSAKFWCLMARAVSRRPFKEKALVQSQASATEVCWTQNGAGTGCSPSISAFACQYHSANAPHSFTMLDGVWGMEAWLPAGRAVYIFCKVLRPVQVKNCLIFHGTVPGAKRPEQEVCLVHVRTSAPSEAMLD